MRLLFFISLAMIGSGLFETVPMESAIAEYALPDQPAPVETGFSRNDKQPPARRVRRRTRRRTRRRVERRQDRQESGFITRPFDYVLHSC
jgi:hypothetical protein